MIRIAALRFTPLLVLGLALALLLAAAWTGLAALERSRLRLATIEAQAAAGSAARNPLLPAAATWHQPDRRAAETALLGVLRNAATERRLLVERVELPLPAERRPTELSVELSVSGPEADVLRFARTIEAGAPTIRFARWRLARTGRAETAIRLEARAVAWREPR